jgi:hypothetical protein
MCQLRTVVPGLGIDESLVLASVLVTKCEQPNVHFLIYNKDTKNFFLFAAVKSLRNYWCCPEIKLDIEDIFDRRQDYMDRQYWPYKKKHLDAFIPVDVKTFNRNNQMPLANEAAVRERNSRWDIIIGAPIPEESQLQKRQRPTSATTVATIADSQGKRQATGRKPKTGILIFNYLKLIN